MTIEKIIMFDSLGWLIAKIKCKLGGGKPALNAHLRKKGIIIGQNSKTATNIRSAEPYLITIGDNVTISHNVDFITHDNSVCKIYGVYNDIYGRITVGDNCFIGAHAVLMYGITIADNVIIAAGSVVTKSITQSNVVVAGCPAKIIGTWEQFGAKVADNVMKLGNLSFVDKKNYILKNESKLIKR